jgi:two-component system sensor histidine kinase BaeS
MRTDTKASKVCFVKDKISCDNCFYGGAVHVSVRDGGPGIAPEDLPHIFERFYRGDKSRARSSGGTGLGLSIAKALIEAHGGKIWAENAPQGGACFHFTVPP